jgi:hypothetical protein
MKKLSNTTKVLRYVKQNPLAKAKEVAQAVGVPVNTVYQVVYLAKKKLSNGQVVSVLTPNAQASLALFSDPPKRGKLSEEDFKKLPLPRIAYDDYGRVKLRMMGSPQWDSVNHPPHYKVGGIETIDFIEAKSLSYNLGNVVKYITRADHKGNTLEDLKKAQWYLNREVQTMEKAK